jgi:hypothetical protein
MGSQHTHSALKHQRRQRRLLAKRKRKEELLATPAPPPPAKYGFVGAMDGAPDDQIVPERVPNAWHSIGLIIGPNPSSIFEFCNAIVKHSGHPNFRLHKWNGGTSKTRAARQLSFAKGFVGAIRKIPAIYAYAIAAQAKEIDVLWQSTDITQLGIARFVIRPDGKQVVHWGPFSVMTKDGPREIDFEMHIDRAKVILWTAIALGAMYTWISKQIGSKPLMSLLCDRLPGDSSGRGLSVILHILATIADDRITLQVKPPNDHRPDNDAEYLADCIATWARDHLEHPERKTAQALQQLFDDPTVANRFRLRRNFLLHPPTTTAARVNPLPS